MALTPTRRGVKMPDSGPTGQPVRVASWALLVLLLAATIVATFVLGPPEAPLAPAEATHALQAASLAHDFDLQYTKEDFERFAVASGGPPEGLYLRSPDRGERIAFGVPVPYAVATAPVVRLAPDRPPQRGLWLANALFLALACLAAATTLERRIGPAAPLWVAAFAFASVTFAFVFRAGPELFAAGLVACAFALAYRGEGAPAARFTEIYSGPLPGEEAGRAAIRWLGAGFLAGTAAVFHPLYLILLWPLALAVPRGRRRVGVPALLVTALLALGLWAWISAAAGGGAVPWQRGGRLFTPETGFPAVDVPVAAWPAEEVGLAPGDLLPGGVPERWPGLSVIGWDLLFLGFGRHLGLLPYFLPLVLAFTVFLGARGRRWIAPAVALALGGLVATSPYDLSGAGTGGPAALGAAFFLPLYPALWFVAARPLRPRWVVALALLAGLFLYPVWLDPVGAATGRSHPSAVAAHILPFESTQTALAGVTELQHGALWVRLPGERGGVAAGRDDALLLPAGSGGALWLGSPVPVAALHLQLLPGGPTRAEIEGAETLRTVLSPDGGVSFVLDPGAPGRRHTVAWSSTPYAFYRLAVGFPESDGAPVGFRIEPQYREP